MIDNRDIDRGFLLGEPESELLAKRIEDPGIVITLSVRERFEIRPARSPPSRELQGEIARSAQAGSVDDPCLCPATPLAALPATARSCGARQIDPGAITIRNGRYLVCNLSAGTAARPPVSPTLPLSTQCDKKPYE